VKVKEQIRERYAAAANAADRTAGSSCCGTSSCCGDGKDQITSNLYQIDEVSDLPEKAVLASLGCGNPTALAELKPGETVLDLGSGGGIDVLLSARRVGPTGKAYGVDMTDEMLALARKNAAEAGATNVEFLKGEIEALPLPDNSVDVIISNCVVNLSTDKDQVFREAFRVLRPGGRLAISDVIFRGDVSSIPDAVKKAIDMWTGCVAGALEEQDYIRRLQAAGFTDAAIEVTRVYGADMLDHVASGCCGAPAEQLGSGVEVASGFVRARKPA